MHSGRKPTPIGMAFNAGFEEGKKQGIEIGKEQMRGRVPREVDILDLIDYSVAVREKLESHEKNAMAEKIHSFIIERMK